MQTPPATPTTYPRTTECLGLGVARGPSPPPLCSPTPLTWGGTNTHTTTSPPHRTVQADVVRRVSQALVHTVAGAATRTMATPTTARPLTPHHLPTTRSSTPHVPQETDLHRARPSRHPATACGSACTCLPLRNAAAHHVPFISATSKRTDKQSRIAQHCRKHRASQSRGSIRSGQPSRCRAPHRT